MDGAAYVAEKILSGETNQPRSAIVTIAAKPEAERVKAVERMERGEPPEPEVKTKEWCRRIVTKCAVWQACVGSALSCPVKAKKGSA